MKYFFSFIAFCCACMVNAQNIVKVEYWIDHDPGFDSALQVVGIPSLPDINNIMLTSSNLLSEGVHTIGFRSKDSNGLWSHTNFIPLFVTDSSQGLITEVEYFWDADSGFGNSYLDTIYAAPIADRMNDTLLTYLPILGLGSHTLYVRSKDHRNRWSHTNYIQVAVNGTVTVQQLEDEFGIKIFPIPAHDLLNVEMLRNDNVKILGYSSEGKFIFKYDMNKKSQIDISRLLPGSYQVIFWTKENQIYKSKFVKE